MEEENKKNLIVVDNQKPITDVFSNIKAFSDAQRICKALTQSGIVPTSYQGEANIPNAMVALEMANRIGISPISVMQNLHVIEGKPSWSSNFIISMINSSGKFTPLRFKYENKGLKKMVRTGKKWNKKFNQYDEFKEEEEVEDITCIAYAYDKNTGEIIEGPEASIEMAMQEGWLTKNGSKWKTMPKLMLAYRAAAFFGRLYTPELLLGIHSDFEIFDAAPVVNDICEIKVPNLAMPAEEPKKRGRKPKDEITQTNSEIKDLSQENAVDEITPKDVEFEEVKEPETVEEKAAALDDDMPDLVQPREKNPAEQAPFALFEE